MPVAGSCCVKFVLVKLPSFFKFILVCMKVPFIILGNHPRWYFAMVLPIKDCCSANLNFIGICQSLETLEFVLWVVDSCTASGMAGQPDT